MKLKAIVIGVRLSGTGKMPCRSWSLQAIDTCPGSVDLTHSSGLVEACRGCYATTGNYMFPNVKAPRVHNRDDWKRDDWEADMVSAIGNDPYFRWFDSGDVYSLSLALKIYNVMKGTPNTKHWLPTRMHKFAKFKPVFAKMMRLANVAVRKSSDGIAGERVRGLSSTIFDPAMPNQAAGAFVCEAYSRDGKCGDCRACWDKTVTVIAYPQHGKKMAKVNRDIIAIAA